MLQLVQTLLKPRRCRTHLDSRCPDHILTLPHRDFHRKHTPSCNHGTSFMQRRNRRPDLAPGDGQDPQAPVMEHGHFYLWLSPHHPEVLRTSISVATLGLRVLTTVT